MKILLSIFMVLMFSSYGIVKHKKYNYYELNNKNIVSDFLTLEKADTTEKRLELKCEKKIAQSPKELFFSIAFSPKALLDTNLIKDSYSWKHMDEVFPIDTITNINLQFSTKKDNTLKIPYKFIDTDNYSSLSVNHYKEIKSYTINPVTLCKNFDEFKSLYNNRDSLISYEYIHRYRVLCELDLNNIDYKNLKKNKLVANFIIEFSNGRKLSIEKSISVY